MLALEQGSHKRVVTATRWDVPMPIERDPKRPDDGRREARMLALMMSVFFVLSLAFNALTG